MTISLRPVTIDNWQAVIDLKLAPGQDEFVASNLYSLAESKFGVEYLGHWDLFPLAIYNEEDLVGFFMHGFNFDCQKYECFIFRLMIAESHQGHGYGRAAMRMMLQQFNEDKRINKVGISYNPRNSVAQKLYSSLGFIETGEIFEGELIAIYPK